MYFREPHNPKCAVIFARQDPEINNLNTVDTQEAICRRYCNDNRIPVLRSVRIRCGSQEALELLRYLLRTLPPEVDTVFAYNATTYSILLRELGLLCLQFQCRKTWLCSLDITGRMYQEFHMITPEDMREANQRYLEAIQ